MKVDDLLRFINVNDFQKGKECGDKSFITPPSLFEITKPFISTEIPYCELNEITKPFISIEIPYHELNEIELKHFLKRFHKHTNNGFRIVIT